LSHCHATQIVENVSSECALCRSTQVGHGTRPDVLADDRQVTQGAPRSQMLRLQPRELSSPERAANCCAARWLPSANVPCA
ncbi:MAG: hypothetical protein ACOZQL_14850, partial [Myxococcota bacterium]